MPCYRAYFLDEDDHITGTEIIEIADLGAALVTAKKMLKDLPLVPAVELWEGEKMVCAFPPSAYERRARKATRARRSDRLVSPPHLALADMTPILSRLASAREELRPMQRSERRRVKR